MENYIMFALLIFSTYLFIKNYVNSNRRVFLDRLAYSLLTVSISFFVSVYVLDFLVQKIFVVNLGKKFYLILLYIVSFITPIVFVLILYAIVFLIVNSIVGFLVNKVLPVLQVPQPVSYPQTPQPSIIQGTTIQDIQKREKVQSNEIGEKVQGVSVGGSPNILKIAGGSDLIDNIVRSGAIVGAGQGEEYRIKEDIRLEKPIDEENVDVVISTPEVAVIEEEKKEQEEEIERYVPEIRTVQRVSTVEDIKRVLLQKLVELGYSYSILNINNFIVESEETLPNGSKKYKLVYTDVVRGLTMSFECVVTPDGRLKITDMKF